MEEEIDYIFNIYENTYKDIIKIIVICWHQEGEKNLKLKCLIVAENLQEGG